VFNYSTTRLLIEMLSADKTLRRLCGWQRAGEVPSGGNDKSSTQIHAKLDEA